MGRVLQQLLNLVCLTLAVIWTLFCSVGAVIGCAISRKAGHTVQQTWSKGWLFLMGVKVHLINPENLIPGAVLAPNHESMYDILVMGSLPVDFRWISKVEVGKIPFVGQAMRAMGCYFVKRDKSGADINVMKAVEDGLRRGQNVIIFPEGTRTRTGQLLPLKKGAFRVAQNANVPIIPIGIKGTYAIAPPGRFPVKWGHRVVVTVGKPLMVPAGEPIENAMEHFSVSLRHLLGIA